MNNNSQNSNVTEVRVNEKYPEIKIDRKSLKDAKILSLNLASSVSETSAVNQYLYEYFQFEKCYEDIAEIMEKIAIVEMKHLEIIGELITCLGGTANFHYYNNARCLPWNANMIFCNDDIKKLIKFNIESEEKAIRQYKYHAEIIDNGNICQILHRIIKDEELHVKIFKSILERL